MLPVEENEASACFSSYGFPYLFASPATEEGHLSMRSQLDERCCRVMQIKNLQVAESCKFLPMVTTAPAWENWYVSNPDLLWNLRICPFEGNSILNPIKSANPGSWLSKILEFREDLYIARPRDPPTLPPTFA